MHLFDDGLSIRERIFENQKNGVIPKDLTLTLAERTS